MICRICGEDINEKGQENISPISGYPICEDCKEDIMCAECCGANFGYNLYYCEEFDKILCKDCLMKEAESNDFLKVARIYYTDEWHEICSDSDTDAVIEYLKERIGVQEVTE